MPRSRTRQDLHHLPEPLHHERRAVPDGMAAARSGDQQRSQRIRHTGSASRPFSLNTSNEDELVSEI